MEFSLGFEIFIDINVNELIKACLKPSGTHHISAGGASLWPASSLDTQWTPPHSQLAVSSGQVSAGAGVPSGVEEPAWEARARWPVSRQPWSKASASSWVANLSPSLSSVCCSCQLTGQFLSGLWKHPPSSGNEPRNRSNLFHWVGTWPLTWRRGACAASPSPKDNRVCAKLKPVIYSPGLPLKSNVFSLVLSCQWTFTSSPAVSSTPFGVWWNRCRVTQGFNCVQLH